MGRETQHLVQCREHGGMFKHPVRRGRRAVRCAPGYPCDKAGAAETEMPRKVAVKPVSEPHSNRTEVRKDIRRARRQKGTDNTSSRTQAKALEARELLEALDWSTSGKGYTADDGHYRVSMVATRGQELLTMAFADGRVISSEYQLWAADKSATANGKPQPNSKLPFDPDEVGDRELVRYLAGMKVTWWNKLGGREETAIVSPAAPYERKDANGKFVKVTPPSIEITHHFDGYGEEATPGQRMVRFVDYNGGGFRAFYLDQLLTIG